MASSYGMAITNPLLISCSNLCGRSRSSGGFLVHSSLHHEDHELSFPIQKTRKDPIMEKKDLNYQGSLEMARSMLSQKKEPLSVLATIDLFQHLGLDYHFSEEIRTIIHNIYKNFSIFNGPHSNSRVSLHDVALFFRLLRQDGYYVSPEIFKSFMDKNGHFEASLCEDLQGMLSLYEASHFDMGEEILCKANDFSTNHLKDSISHIGLDAKNKIEHSLQHPIHTSLQRCNARHYICKYKGEIGISKVLKDLAIMDFNKVQSLHKSEYLEVLRWWRKLELSKQPSNFRDQPMKWFMWSMTMLHGPQFSKHRIEYTKVIALVYVIDDIFDVLGSLEELALFTETIEIWDSLPMDSLPNYMKICYKTLYNITNEIANFIMREHGWNPIDLLRKSWESLFKAFLVEARWFTLGFTPTANEYLKNGVISSGVHVVLTHLYFLLGDRVSKETIAFLNDNTPKLFSQTGLFLRLWDDLGSAKDENQEGYDGSYVDYYMKDHDASLESAREHTMQMISDAWKRLNKEYLYSTQFSLSMKKSTLNMTRMVSIMYSYQNQKLPRLEDYTRLMLLESI